MARLGFWDIFQPNPDGSISPKKPIKIAGVILDPGQKYSRGMLFSGWDLFQYYGHDIEIEEQPDGQPPVATKVY